MKTYAIYEGPIWFNGCKVNNHFKVMVKAHTIYWAKHEICIKYRSLNGYTDNRGVMKLDESLIDFVTF